MTTLWPLDPEPPSTTQTDLDEVDAQVFACTVRGIPGPQGSKSFKGRPGGKGVMVESSKKVAPWRQDVKHAALDAIDRIEPNLWRLLDGPLIVSMVFTLTRPAGHFGTGRNADQLKPSAPPRPAVYPDLSKLARSTEDALTKIVWADDARIVGYHRLGKYYAGTAAPDVLPAGSGAVIRVWRLDQYDQQGESQ